MLLSDIPAWFAKRFGADATGSYIRTVPATTVDPNAASMSLGFPPNTFVDEGAGGSPPDGRDFNGILNFLSAWAQWVGAGGCIPWNSAIAAAGGYPSGAVVMSNTTAGVYYRSTANNNTTNPDGGGSANWLTMESVLSENLVFNNGYRVHGSGYKECWGRVTVPANDHLVITLPVTHVSFMIPALAGDLNVSPGHPSMIGTLFIGLNDFWIVNNDSVALTVDWSTRGL